MNLAKKSDKTFLRIQVTRFKRERNKRETFLVVSLDIIFVFFRFIKCHFACNFSFINLHWVLILNIDKVFQLVLSQIFCFNFSYPSSIFPSYCLYLSWNVSFFFPIVFLYFPFFLFFFVFFLNFVLTSFFLSLGLVS